MLKYEQLQSLEEYLDQIDKTLLKEGVRYSFEYPRKSIHPWNAEELGKVNKSTLDAVSGSANVYAIFTAEKNSEEFLLRYIGKTKRKLARERIRNHLIKKNERTGAKLGNIVEHVNLGGSVKISWVKIEPESLRNYIEEELIARHSEADWNRENA